MVSISQEKAMEKIPLWRKTIFYSSIFILFVTVEALAELITKKHFLLSYIGEGVVGTLILLTYVLGFFEDSWATKFSKYVLNFVREKVKNERN